MATQEDGIEKAGQLEEAKVEILQAKAESARCTCMLLYGCLVLDTCMHTRDGRAEMEGGMKRGAHGGAPGGLADVDGLVVMTVDVQ